MKIKQMRLPKLGPSWNRKLCFNLTVELGLTSESDFFHRSGGNPSVEFFTHEVRNPADYLDEKEFMLDYLRQEMFSKYPFPFEGVDRRKAALDSFIAGEEACRSANSMLVDWSTRAHLDFSVWARARRIASHVLGRFNLDEMVGRCGFGPGASTSLRRALSSQQNKWDRSSHITAGALPYYMAFYRYCGVRDMLPASLEVVGGNKVTTVPKNGKTDRVIAIEPDWNMFFQKGVGGMIRHRLQRHAGLLTSDAQEKNKTLARIGSANGGYATIDLKQASDCISLALCEALLPNDWLKVLADLRSPVGEVGGIQITYEKVSSMGNGFTFELETLLFYCLCRAVCEDGEVLVYGDDIIIPRGYSEQVLTVLRQAHFTVNPKKTFTMGPFRESCGGHYFCGHDVTPFYVRKPVETLGTAIALANAITDWSERYTGGVSRDPIFRESWETIRRRTPRVLRGPRPFSGCLWSAWDDAMPKWSKSTQSYKQAVVTRVHRYKDLSSKSGSYLYKLWENSHELEASRFSTAAMREKLGYVYLDREQWNEPLAWSLCQ